MSVSLPAKLALGTLAGGATAAGGALAYKEISKPKVKEKKSIVTLIKDSRKDKRLMTKSNGGSEDHWKKGWKAYLDSKRNIWGLSEWKDSPVDTDPAPTSFMNKCESVSREEVVDESDERYVAILNYCTRDTLVSDLISETKGKTLLVKDTNNPSTNSDWLKVWGDYKTKNNGASTDEWDIGSWTSNKDQNNVPVAFMDKCEEKSKVKAHRLDQPEYLKVLEYCTK
ncbi:hypothetical protein HF1_02660 [Mycoplasma haemofelis str. Langford 1]|uniref:Lipoprotein n=1 Tax=Mycoplasma haemofelis (strain Langford 1) TaxID=941640 RepID=E8ZKV8_MYCHL|nr:hypothetical protein [Mycoplasma haemofelis]CBY92274.1 hypothetical protein HF1_02660 [Mycoplasma haemofelis str. Langford 1]